MVHKKLYVVGLVLLSGLNIVGSDISSPSSDMKSMSSLVTPTSSVTSLGVTTSSSPLNSKGEQELLFWTLYGELESKRDEALRTIKAEAQEAIDSLVEQNYDCDCAAQLVESAYGNPKFEEAIFTEFNVMANSTHTTYDGQADIASVYQIMFENYHQGRIPFSVAQKVWQDKLDQNTFNTKDSKFIQRILSLKSQY